MSTRQKKSIVIISGVLVLMTIAIFVSAFFFPLRKSELTENTLKVASELYNQAISSYVIIDSTFSNNNIAFIFQLKLSNGDERYYAVSYYKHFLFSRYRFASYADYSRPDFSGILIATGMPYETIYDISNYSLEYKDSTLNFTLTNIIRGFIQAVLFMCVLLIIRLWKKRGQA